MRVRLQKVNDKSVFISRRTDVVVLGFTISRVSELNVI